MKKFCSILAIWLLTVSWALAEDPGNPLNFTPPNTDFSVLFLTNIFGVVDGVLAGSGGQILGTMFGVFNAAILSLGGILLLYSMMFGTLATAHEGQFLGSKWNSLWVPMRTVAGIALLLPKASGYCMMQVFVMWVVVQGVGAADKIWGAALGYLQRGGVIIQPVAAANPLAGTGSGDISGLIGGINISNQMPNAFKMLQSQVCMYSLQYILRDYYNEQQTRGACSGGSTEWYCRPPPNLGSGIDFINATNNLVLIPFTDDNYAGLNGKCGSVRWQSVDKAALKWNLGFDVDESLIDQSALARVIAVQQMFIEMGGTAQQIVSNHYNRSSADRLPLGMTNADKALWISPDRSKVPLLTGQEIAAAATAYLGIMSPTLNALSSSVKENTQFIEEAKRRGWIMAGAYFFDLLRLNQQAAGYKAEAPGSVTAVSSGAFEIGELERTLGPRVFSQTKQAEYSELLGGASPSCTQHFTRDRYQSVSSYICYANQLKQLGQVGLSSPDFGTNYDVVWETIPPLKDKKFKAGFLNIPGTVITLGYKLLRVIFNAFISILNVILGIFLDLIFKPIFDLTIPFFTLGLQVALQNYGNPIIALSVMGNQLINLAFGVWLIAVVSITAVGAIPYVGNAGTVLASLIGPMIGLWASAMFTTGAIMAYYVPMLPYMIFVFAALGWFISVVEAMVAAPIVALGIMHPEGQHETWGKASPAIMIILSVFLRPAMMIIAFVVGIIISYVGIWLLNAGFQQVIDGMLSGGLSSSAANSMGFSRLWSQGFGSSQSASEGSASSFGSLVGIIFMIVIYVTMYITIVKTAIEQSFIKLTDGVLRFIEGGHGASGQDTQTAVQAAGQAEGAVKGAAQGMVDAASKGVDTGGGNEEDADGGEGGGDDNLQTGPDSGPPSGGQSQQGKGSATASQGSSQKGGSSTQTGGGSGGIQLGNKGGPGGGGGGMGKGGGTGGGGSK